MKSSTRDGHSLVVKNTSMEHINDLLAKNGSLLPEKRQLVGPKLQGKEQSNRVRKLTLLIKQSL